jgi:hypothetical protein
MKYIKTFENYSINEEEFLTGLKAGFGKINQKSIDTLDEICTESLTSTFTDAEVYNSGNKDTKNLLQKINLMQILKDRYNKNQGIKISELQNADIKLSKDAKTLLTEGESIGKHDYTENLLYVGEDRNPLIAKGQKLPDMQAEDVKKAYSSSVSEVYIAASESKNNPLGNARVYFDAKKNIWGGGSLPS